MTTFEMLQELLAQNEFELLLPEDYTANTTEQDIRLVYQMNDTVESFLVFRKAIFTGTYKKDYEGKLDASYDRDQNRYVLGVRQGDSVITLFYQKLELEVNLYNYGEIAHFWVPRYENLRQLEFRIAVLWDKYKIKNAFTLFIPYHQTLSILSFYTQKCISQECGLRITLLCIKRKDR